MLIILAQAKLGENALDQGRDAIAAMVAASNAEEGCLAYTFTTDVLNPNVLHIVEKWVDEAALVAHFQSPHMAAFQQALSGLDVEIVEGTKFQADEGQPIL